MDKRQHILITGASSGLGKAMAEQYAAQGKSLALCARRIERLTDLKVTLTAQYPNIQVNIYQLDVDDHDAVFTVFHQAHRELGHLDRIIVNAGIGQGQSFGIGKFAANKQTALTNFVAAIAQMEAAMEIFRAQQSGHLVTISSVSAVRGFRAGIVYAASKAGVTSLSEGLRLDLLDSPIKVTCVHPGFIMTEINHHRGHASLPFAVDAETGARHLVKAIAKESDNCYVPFWPWALVQVILRIAPKRLLAKLV